MKCFMEDSVKKPVSNTQVAKYDPDTPKVSVVIPLYNKERDIAATLETVVNQRVQPYEIIVVDDGSTDNGAAVARSFADVTLISQRNAGVSAARNRGIAAATGDFVAFLDADDFWSVHFIERMVLMVRAYPKASLYASAYQFLSDGVDFKNPKIRLPANANKEGYFEDYFYAGANGDLPFTMSSMMVRRSEFSRIGVFPLNEPIGEDQDFFARAALRARMAYTPMVLSTYNLGASNRACSAVIPTQPCPFSLRLQHYAESCGSEAERDQILRYCGGHILHLASMHCVRGHHHEAQVLLQHPLTHRYPVRRTWWLWRERVAWLGHWLLNSGRAAHG